MVSLLILVVLAVAISIQLIKLSEKVDKLTMTFSEVKAQLDAVATGVNDLEAAIADLKKQVASGHVITQEELDALGKQAQEIVADIKDPSDQD